MRIAKKRIAELVEAPYNPRIVSEELLEKLKKSIQKFGYVEPIVVNVRNNHVVGGNQRLKVLRELGVEEIEVVLVDLDDEEEKTLNLALNKIIGDWDLVALSEVLKDISEPNLEFTGFDRVEIESILDALSYTEQTTREIMNEKLPEIEEYTIVRVKIPNKIYSEVIAYLQERGCIVSV